MEAPGAPVTTPVDRWVHGSAALPIDAIGHAVVTADLRGVVTAWNAAATDMYGWTAQEAIGRRITDLVAPTVTREQRCSFVAQVRAGRSWSGELLVCDKDGRWFLAVVTETPMFDDQGEVVGIVAAAVAVGGHPTQRPWRSDAWEKAVDVMFVFDAEGTILYTNAAAERLLGDPPDVVAGRHWSDYVHEEDRGEVGAAFERARGGVHATVRFRIRDGAGSWRWAAAAGDPLGGAASGSAVVAVVQDIHEQVAVEQRLEQTDSRFRAIVQSSSDAAVIAVPDPSARISYASPAVERIFGYSPDEVVGASGFDFVHPDDQAAAVEAFERVLAGEAIPPVEMRVQHRDGSWRWVEEALTNLADDPSVGGIVGNLRDITSRRELELALSESEQRYRTIVEAAGEGICLYGADGRVQYANPRLAAIVGVTVEELGDRSVLHFVHPDDRERVLAGLHDRIEGSSDRYDVRLLAVDGSVVHVRIAAEPLRNAHGEAEGGIALVTDISDRLRNEAELRRLALTDPLTGLPNRTLLVDRAEQALLRAERHGHQVAILFIDLDLFKLVNDSLGHSHGDALLQAIAGRLEQRLRSAGTTVARFGGDEFVVLCEDVTDPGIPDVIAERIHDALNEPVIVNGHELRTSASIGIAVGPSGSAESLIAAADAAMYDAKESGRNRAARFDLPLRTRAARRMSIGADLRRAIEERQLEVHYQPVVALDSGSIAAFEALVRWDHPEHGWVPPSEFVEIAEQNGLVSSLSTLVFDEACSQVARWRAASGRSIRLSVNLSALQVTDPDLPVELAVLFGRHGITGADVVLEITESALMATSMVPEALARLRALGVSLALDDFGTGYSSLLYLRRYPVDVLKLDREFVAGVADDPEDEAIVHAVVELARTMGLVAVAEGVETDAQLRALRALGCHCGQGWGWSPAVVADEAVAMARTDPWVLERQPAAS